MRSNWIKEIRRAVGIVLVVMLGAIAINAVRTPILNAAADKDKISRARAWDLSGLKLIDNWSHRGWPNVNKNEGGTGEPKPDDGAAENQIWPINSLTAKQFFDEGECIFVDARAPEYYEESHIAGAIDWPADDFDIYYDDLSEQVPMDSCVVVYCIGGACDESYHLATSLLLMGWKEIYLYEGGIGEWEAAGYPVESGDEATTSSTSETEPVTGE